MFFGQFWIDETPNRHFKVSNLCSRVMGNYILFRFKNDKIFLNFIQKMVLIVFNVCCSTYSFII